MKRKKPEYICHSCGLRFCTGPVNEYATFSFGICECCGAEEVPCTQPRDYGGFTAWPLPDGTDPLPSPRTFDDLIEVVLDSFEFEEVHACMKLLNWQWVGTGGESLDVPSVDRMRQVARNLLVSIVNSRTDNIITTGGFQAEKIVDDCFCDQGLILRFIVSESEHYFGDYYED